MDEHGPCSSLLLEDSAAALEGLRVRPNLSGARVVVAGGHGMLGGWVVYELLRMRDLWGLGPSEIVVLTSNPNRKGAIWRERHTEVEVREVVDPGGDAVPDADIYFHLASPASASAFLAKSTTVVDLNVELTQNILLRAKSTRGGRKVVFASSSEVYGIAQGLLSEGTPGLIPNGSSRWIYAESKRLGEALCRLYAENFGVITTSIRPFHTFGPGLRPDDQRVFGDFVSKLVDGAELVVRGDPNTRRTFAYAPEVAAAFLLAASEAPRGSEFNVAGRESIAIGQLARDLTNQFYGHEARVLMKTDPAAPTNPNPTAEADISLIAELGWSPSTGVIDAFRKTVRYVQMLRAQA